MDIANTLIEIAEKANQVSELDEQLTTILNGGDTGRKGHYDDFWDRIQRYGETFSYSGAFNSQLWDDVTYNPKYTIKSSTGAGMFANNRITDTKVPVDLSTASGTSAMLSWSSIRIFRKLIVNENLSFSGAFDNATYLTEINIEGIIGKAIDMHWSKLLNKASFISVISALSTTTSGLTATFSKTAKENAFKDVSEWEALVATKPNWTITLA